MKTKKFFNNKNEEGAALLTVIAVSLAIFTALGLITSTLALSNTSVSVARSQLQAFSSAEAGRDQILERIINKEVCTSSNNTSRGEVLPQGNNGVGYSWRVLRYEGNSIPQSSGNTRNVEGCPIDTTEYFFILTEGMSDKDTTRSSRIVKKEKVEALYSVQSRSNASGEKPVYFGKQKDTFVVTDSFDPNAGVSSVLAIPTNGARSVDGRPANIYSRNSLQIICRPYTTSSTGAPPRTLRLMGNVTVFGDSNAIFRNDDCYTSGPAANRPTFTARGGFEVRNNQARPPRITAKSSSDPGPYPNRNSSIDFFDQNICTTGPLVRRISPNFPTSVAPPRYAVVLGKEYHWRKDPRPTANSRQTSCPQLTALGSNGDSSTAWIDYNPTISGATPIVSFSDANYCSADSSLLRTFINNRTTDTVINLTSCPRVNWQAGVYSPKADVTVVGNAHTATNVTINKTGAPDGKSLSIVTPDLTTSSIARAHCPNANNTINLTNVKWLDGVSGLVYTPCRIHISGESIINGQLYAGTIQSRLTEPVPGGGRIFIRSYARVLNPPAHLIERTGSDTNTRDVNPIPVSQR